MSAPAVPDSTTLPGRLARIPSGRRTKWIVLAAWLIAIVALGGFAGKLNGAEKNDNIQWLPGAAESTQAYQLGQRFGGSDEVPVVFVYERTSGLTDADRAVAAADVSRFASVPGVSAPGIVGPVPSKDGQALEVLVPIPVGHGGWNTIGATVGQLKDAAGPPPPGLTMLPTGPAGYAAEFSKAFKGIDGTLLYATAAVVIVILLFTYGPMLWILPLLAAGGALSIAMSAVYGATGTGLTVTAQSAGILTILVFGAGTDYALLLIARYREELRRHEDKHDAMAVALHRAGPAILASGTTVIIAMLVLLVAQLNSTKGVGPVCAIGVAVALLAMLTLLPALMVVAGRWIFWPRHPHFGTADHTATGIWSRVGTFVAGRPRTVWIGTGAVLVALAFGMTGLHDDGIANQDAFTTTTDAVHGNQALARHFDQGTGSPVIVIANSAKMQEVSSALASTPGIAAPTAAHTSGDLMQIQATLTDAPDSAAAGATVDRLRANLHRIDGADAKVGGDTAVRIDIERAAAHDNRTVVPIVLLVVMAILMLLLRSLLAPILLTLTVVLSFFAALGLSTLAFHAAGFHGADASLPLLSFVFLVALGIDYNIFLMSRVHEEARTHGTRRGALTGLSATGGVITSAGLVLAGTFAVFATMPIVSFAEVGLVIMIGVLLDTLIVRSILVTALSLDLGDRIWWPSRLTRRTDPEAEREPVAALN
ncbi:MMPL family transporter [Nocardia sp. alder85J]|uniref:MMPL family transporter n=1 Tax=Nocardia sp. alder85J TaxID=2862949 RepID=UPI001CD2B3FF|nr:MMPL family transporter [Nocardia sp. alder85J]MCX4095296.1 MMPL family transporter [Nocardia sp. alder85J]